MGDLATSLASSHRMPIALPDLGQPEMFPYFTRCSWGGGGGGAESSLGRTIGPGPTVWPGGAGLLVGGGPYK